MSWENVIVGYKIQDFKKEDIIPEKAVFIRSVDRFVRMIGWISNPYPYYETIYQYQVPIYKKKNIKRLTHHKNKVNH